MLRDLITFSNKPVTATFKASENMTMGMAVSIDYANDEVDKATGIGEFLVTVPKKYEGEYSYKNPTDDAFEAILDGDTVNVIPTVVGESYATDQLTVGNPAVAKGAYLKVASGLFVAAAQNDSAGWVYGGAYSDPTGAMHVIERVSTVTVP
jgi:hypothetical protein